jgi:hypothetical protein
VAASAGVGDKRGAARRRFDRRKYTRCVPPQNRNRGATRGPPADRLLYATAGLLSIRGACAAPVVSREENNNGGIMAFGLRVTCRRQYPGKPGSRARGV